MSAGRCPAGFRRRRTARALVSRLTIRRIYHLHTAPTATWPRVCVLDGHLTVTLIRPSTQAYALTGPAGRGTPVAARAVNDAPVAARRLGQRPLQLRPCRVLLMFPKVFVDELDGAFSDGRGDPLHRAVADVASGKHSRQAGLQQQRRPAQRPVLGWPAGGRRGGSSSGSPMGRVYRETTPAMLARVTAALDDWIGCALEAAGNPFRVAAGSGRAWAG